MSYYLAPSLVELRGEINARWPNRDKASDGWIGDADHSSRISDHNPDEKGCVHALDVDVDGIGVQQLLRATIGDNRVWYVIFNHRIYSRTYGWTPRVYTGSNPHTMHVHISIRYNHAAENATRTWLGDRKPKPTKGGRLPLVDLSNVLRQIERAERENAGIKRIQRQLNSKYDLQLAVDGWWGPRTRAAYAQHEQTIDARVPDGIPGMRSLTVLGRGRFRVRA